MMCRSCSARPPDLLTLALYRTFLEEINEVSAKHIRRVVSETEGYCMLDADSLQFKRCRTLPNMFNNKNNELPGICSV